MRTFTEKDRRGLAVAFRIFVRAMSGERTGTAAAEKLVVKATSEGVGIDELLNKENWARAAALEPELTAERYAEMLIREEVETRPLTAEPMWHEPSYGFTVIAEAVHDYYKEVTGRGGKWNIPSALSNLAHAIRKWGLQTILSEDLIAEVNATGANKDYTSYGYILALVKDFDTFHPETLTEPQEERMERKAARAEEEERACVTETDPDPEPEPGEGDTGDPEDEPYPEPGDDDGEGASEGTETGIPDPAPFQEDEPAQTFESSFDIRNNARELKRNSIRNFIFGYTTEEISALAGTIAGGTNLNLDEIVDALTDGQFDEEAENTAAASMHKNLNADLTSSFIACVLSLDVDMDDEKASQYDILKCNWDLRTPSVRKFYKVKNLIEEKTREYPDPDLKEAVRDLERLYASEEED